MSEALSTDLRSAAESIREEIQAAFVRNIAPEAWTAMIEKELKAFAEPSTLPGGYGQLAKSVPSPLSRIIQEELGKEVRTKLAEHIKDGFPGGLTAENMMREWIDANGVHVIHEMFASSVSALFKSALDGRLPDPHKAGFARDGTWMGG